MTVHPIDDGSLERFSVHTRPEVRLSATPAFSGHTRAGHTVLIEGEIFGEGGTPFASPGEELLTRFLDRGPASLRSIDGDFVACFVTPDRVRLFKSFTSQYQLYYRERDRAISNRLVYLATGEALIPFDEDYFVAHTLIVPGMQFHMGRTPISGVNRVLPGELVELPFRPEEPVNLSQLISRRYAYKLDAKQRIEDVAPALRELLRKTVRDRIAAAKSNRISVEISGGLDSSLIACLIGEATSKVTGIMFSRPDVPSHHISEGYAREVAERYGIDLHILAPSDLPKVPLARAPYSDEPSDFFWFGELFAHATALRVPAGSSVFSGFGADQLFLRSPSFLPYLLAKREFGAFRNALGPASKLLSRSQVHLSIQSAISQIPRDLYYRLAEPFRKRRWNPLDVGDVNLHRTLYNPVSWLVRGNEQELFEKERLAAEYHLVGDGIICDDWGYFAAPHAVSGPHFQLGSLRASAPYCDLRLIDFMYDNVSALLIHNFEGRYKELLREVAKGILPESLRARKNDMFVFNSFQKEYIESAAPELEALLQRAPSQWIRSAEANKALSQLRFGIATSSTRSLIAFFGYMRWRERFTEEAKNLHVV